MYVYFIYGFVVEFYKYLIIFCYVWLNLVWDYVWLNLVLGEMVLWIILYLENIFLLDMVNVFGGVEGYKKF